MRRSCCYGEKARRHPCSRWHLELVLSYRAERERQESQLEAVTHGYAADRELYVKLGGKRLVTFQDWLIGHAGGAA